MSIIGNHLVAEREFWAIYSHLIPWEHVVAVGSWDEERIPNGTFIRRVDIQRPNDYLVCKYVQIDFVDGEPRVWFPHD